MHQLTSWKEFFKNKSYDFKRNVLQKDKDEPIFLTTVNVNKMQKCLQKTKIGM